MYTHCGLVAGRAYLLGNAGDSLCVVVCDLFFDIFKSSFNIRWYMIRRVMKSPIPFSKVALCPGGLSDKIIFTPNE